MQLVLLHTCQKAQPPKVHSKDGLTRNGRVLCRVDDGAVAADRNDIFEKFTECAVGDDYIDAALFFAERIKQDAERFREEVEKLDIPVTVITEADCIPDHYKNDINGKIIAINPAILKPEYQRADRQLFLVTGGFGASANARASAVFCKNLYDGKNTRYERMDVLGEVKPERMPDWAKEKAAAFSRTIQGKDHER